MGPSDFLIRFSQELEDAAMKVLEDQARIKALLEERSAELAVIKEEYETKKKEVMPRPYIAPPCRPYPKSH